MLAKIVNGDIGNGGNGTRYKRERSGRASHAGHPMRGKSAKVKVLRSMRSAVATARHAVAAYDGQGVKFFPCFLLKIRRCP